MVFLFYWGVFLVTMLLGALVVVGIAWSPLAAVMLYRTMSRRGYKGLRYAWLGAWYSIAFLVPWVLAMLEDWNPEQTGFSTGLAYALLYAMWTAPIMYGLFFSAFDFEEAYWYTSYLKVWLALTAVAWVGSLLWLTKSRPSAGDPDGLPRPHQVQPFALFAIGIVSLTAPLFI